MKTKEQQEKDYSWLLKATSEDELKARLVYTPNFDNKPYKEKYVFGKWVVSKNGDMCHDNKYDIISSRLTEENWIIHLSEKVWINWNEFIPAYLQALRNANIKKVTILSDY